MNCFSELTYSMYADGELPAEEARRVETHLAGCTRCRALMESLWAENHLLTEALQEAEEVALVAARPMRARDILWTGLGVLAVAASLRAFLGWVEEMRPPAAVDWLNPFSLTAQLNLFFSSVFYFVREGATLLISSITTVSVLVFGLLVVVGGVLWLRRRPAAVAVLATLALVLGLALPGSALERRKGKTITIPKGQTLDDSLVATGENVNIDGIVTGDLFVFGRRATIRGTVEGDVICFAQTLDVDGTVGGNVYSWAQRVNVRGQIDRSVYVFVQGIQLDPGGRIAGDVVTFSGEANLDGTVGRDVSTFAGSTDVRGSIGRHLTARTGRLILMASARVGGNLTAYVHKQEDVDIDPGATIAGKMETHLPQPKPSRFTRPKFYLWQGVWLAAAFVTGLLLYWLLPALFRTRLETGGAVVRTMGLGFLALVVTPVAALVAGITVIGLPLALLGVLILAAGIYLAKILVGVFVGRALRRSFGAQPAQFALDLLVGLVVLAVATHIPYVGWVVSSLVVMLGLGIAVSNVRRSWQRPRSAT